MLDEKTFRKDTFTEGVWIRLDDGSRWSFPRPMFQLTPVVGPDGKITFNEEMTLGSEEYGALVEEFIASTEPLEELRALLALAVALLSKNYTLGPAEYRVLLPYRSGDELNRSMWQEIGDLAVGRVPKAMTSGSESAA